MFVEPSLDAGDVDEVQGKLEAGGVVRPLGG